MYSIAANNLVPHTKIIRAHEEGIASYLESIALLNCRNVALTCACAIILISASHHVNILYQSYNILTISHSLH